MVSLQIIQLTFLLLYNLGVEMAFTTLASFSMQNVEKHKAGDAVNTDDSWVKQEVSQGRDV